MAKNNRNLSMSYPEEKEGKTKDANKKLKSQIRSLKKTVKQLESQVKTLSRSFDKSCDFIQTELKDKELPEILTMIDNFDHKETEKGRQLLKKPTEFSTFGNCPKCNVDTTKGFRITKFKARGFRVESCPCGYRTRINDEGSESS